MLNLFRRTEPRPEEVYAASLRNDRAYDDLREALHGLLDERNGKRAKGEEVKTVIEILSVVQVATGFMAVVVTGLMAAGFVRLAWRERGLIGNLATAIVLIHTVVFLRTLYRDMLPLVVDENLLWSGPTFVCVTLVLNLLIVLSGWHGLKALHLAIPESVRERYSLMTAALYPPLRRR